MKLRTVQNIVKEVLPEIEKHYGWSKFKDEPPYIIYDEDIYARLSGEKGMRGEDTPDAEYCWTDNEIIIYYPNMKSRKHIIQTLIHEWQHYLQSQTWMTRYYDMGYDYYNHPYELAATDEEKNYKIFV